MELYHLYTENNKDITITKFLEIINHIQTILRNALGKTNILDNIMSILPLGFNLQNESTFQAQQFNRFQTKIRKLIKERQIPYTATHIIKYYSHHALINILQQTTKTMTKHVDLMSQTITGTNTLFIENFIDLHSELYSKHNLLQKHISSEILIHICKIRQISLIQKNQITLQQINTNETFATINKPFASKPKNKNSSPTYDLEIENEEDIDSLLESDNERKRSSPLTISDQSDQSDHDIKTDKNNSQQQSNQPIENKVTITSTQFQQTTQRRLLKLEKKMKQINANLIKQTTYKIKELNKKKAKINSQILKMEYQKELYKTICSSESSSSSEYSSSDDDKDQDEPPSKKRKLK